MTPLGALLLFSLPWLAFIALVWIFVALTVGTNGRWER